MYLHLYYKELEVNIQYFRLCISKTISKEYLAWGMKIKNNALAAVFSDEFLRFFLSKLVEGDTSESALVQTPQFLSFLYEK